jgi:hypothetical protein
MSYFPDWLDSSMLATFKSCPAKFNLEYLQHWKSKEPSVHLHAGASFARGLEVARRAFYEQGLPPTDAAQRGRAALEEAYGDFPCPSDSGKSKVRMAGALDFYFANYPLSWDLTPPLVLPGGKLGIEYSFAHPLPINNPVTGQPILYVGRMDMLCNYEGLRLIEDDKTTRSLGPTWSQQWDLRSQFIGYDWACWQDGIEVDGALIRGVSILKTKYETQQALIKVAAWQRQRWYDEMLEWVRRIIRCWEAENGFLHNFDHACTDFGGCAFRRVCQSQDESPWLETYFERRIWSPLTRTETKI